MSFKLVTVLAYNVLLVGLAISSDDVEFTFHGFRSANLSLDGIARITSNGLLQLTNNSGQSQIGQSFYSAPVKFKNSSNGSTFSFSTSFVFAIVPQYPRLSGHGLALVIAPTRGLPGAAGAPYLGLFNETNNGNDTNHIVAVELDTISNNIFGDINDNHVGVDINDLKSVTSNPAGYYDDKNGIFQNSTLISGRPMQVWVEYNAEHRQVNVTLAPLGVGKPHTPLLSLPYDLSTILKQTMYVGFSSSTGTAPTSHYVLGWSFKMNGIAQGLDLSKLPKLPRRGANNKVSDFLKFGLPQICIVSLLIATAAVSYYVISKRKFAEVLEEWELAYGTHRFNYKDLYAATKGFKEKQLLGAGGFGRVYKGLLPTTKTEVAVKKISHESRQGMREFVAEIVSMGRLRHRNLVPLLGYCRRKGELLLVYEYMSNGSLDKFLHVEPPFILSWNQRFKIINGVASALLYLHEEWEQVVIHRDVKASNVLLDGELNGRLGDFGLARLYDHGSAPQSTHVVGTLGYLAPEHNITGKATTSTDVYAFGAFLLEVACGRRPIEPRASSEEEAVLIHWVFSCLKSGEILEAVDQNLMSEFVREEAELVLKLGLLCSHSEPIVRPSMRQVTLYLEGSVAMPELSSFGISAVGLASAPSACFEDLPYSFPFTKEAGSTYSSSIANSLLSGGR